MSIDRRVPSAVGVVLLAICVYVVCIILLQINWSNQAYSTECQSSECPESHDDTRHGHNNTGKIIETKSNLTRILSTLLQSNCSKNWKEIEDIPDGFNSCFLYRKLEKAGMPIIHSVFADLISQQVVFTGVLRNYFDSWHSQEFVCVFEVRDEDYIITISDPIVQDFKRFGDEAQFSVIITCPLPKELSGRSNFTMALRLASNLTLAYERITVCPSVAHDSPKYFLTMCTMTKNMDRYIPNWLDYHERMGVEHVYIYDNSAKSFLPRTARTYVETGFLTIIPWAHEHSSNKTYLEVQVASENDCMWRYKHTSHWIVKIDVDEFLQPMDPKRPMITDYLRDDHLNLDHLGSVRIQNWFFCRHRSINYGMKSLGRTRSVFERNLIRNAEPVPINRGRDKAIARPVNVHFYKIHGIKLGGDTITLSPRTELRMVHYRGDNPRHQGYCSGKPIADFSMIRLWYKLNDADVAELNVNLKKMSKAMKRVGIGDAT